MKNTLIDLKVLHSKIGLFSSIFMFSLIINYQLFSQTNPSWPIPRSDQKLSGFVDIDIPTDFDIKWTFKTEAEIKSSPVVVDNKIVVSSADSYVYCLDTKGSLLWKYQGDNAFEASPIVLEDLVYVGDLTGFFYAIDLKTGKEIWKHEAENQIMATANYWQTGEKTYLLVGSYDFFLHCIDAKTGALVWKYELDNYLNGAVSIDDGKAVFGGCDGFLHFIDIDSGKLVAKYNIDTYIASSPVAEKGKAYVGNYDGLFFCIDLKTGEQLWQYDNPNFNLPFIGSPALSGDFIIATNRDKIVYCWNKNTGELIWKYNTRFKIDASPLVSEKAVMVVNMRGDISILNLKDGSLLGEYELGSPVFSNPAILPSKFYFGAMDGSLYCLE